MYHLRNCHPSADIPGGRPCAAKELFNLFVAIDVRGLAVITIREKPCGGNFAARFYRAVPNSEASNGAQTPSPSRRFSLRGLCGPAKRQFPGYVRRTLGLEKRHEIP